MTPKAYITRDEDGVWAHIEFGGGGPFCFLDAPNDLTMADAVAWARARADWILVRVNDSFFSAGSIQVESYPRWQDEQRPRAETPPPSVDRLTVVASFVWLGEEPGRLATAIETLISARPGVSAIASWIDGRRITVQFDLEPPLIAEPDLAASEILREAWGSLTPKPAKKYDMSQVSVTRTST